MINNKELRIRKKRKKESVFLLHKIVRASTTRVMSSTYGSDLQH